jgi:hypothetical protein
MSGWLADVGRDERHAQYLADQLDELRVTCSGRSR